MAESRCMLLAALVCAWACACGGSQKGTDTKSAGDASAKGAQLTIVVTSARSSNDSRPFRVVARAVDYNTFLTDTYTNIAAMVMNPDDTVSAVEVIYPGHETRLTVAKPAKDSVALYFLFTNPDAAWKVYLEQPVSSTVALGDNSASPATASPSLDPDEPGDEDAKKGMPTRRKLALASGGLGVGSLIAGTVLGLVANSKYDQGLATCADMTAGTGCSQEGVDLGTQAQNYGLGANISFAVGAAAIAAGAILWFTTPSSKEKKSGVSAFRWQPYAAPDSAGVMVRGSF